MAHWHLFFGDGEPHKVHIKDLPPPPPWRQFQNSKKTDLLEELKEQEEEIKGRWEAIQRLAESKENERGRLKGEKFRLYTKSKDSEYASKAEKVAEAVNAALYLRRPLLITGNPGSGKTSLAYAIAHELKLGPVLSWAISTRSTFQDGLYRYDAIARLQEKGKGEDDNIGDYLRLGPVGTAFLPSQFPRVLLIDEIDKSDINLPNELLHLFEEGTFEIPELSRWIKKTKGKEDETAENSSSPTSVETRVEIRTEDKGIMALTEGTVRCTTFPIVIMTSNGERDFPPAFMRRCLQVNMPNPSSEALQAIVKAHFNGDEPSFKKVKSAIDNLITEFLSEDEEQNERATDQLLNAIYLRANLSAESFEEGQLKDLLFKGLSASDEPDDE
ncbi:MoxR family ATPase [Nostoc sp. ATCC 53789]|uniref:AAA family ATPase n=1 Tax=Nostoc sp. ATCC 53789 TaxID=76335 RepID=UPI000DEC3D26|nr:MoxR family ATPase [Nostoc sp. ATCC 53789]QHG20716.1 AAA family ATPase [Nostoc sp. ATCC 53789]RCJ15468.1 ATPase [Nostoc sp. ATCC 53789]